MKFSISNLRPQIWKGSKCIEHLYLLLITFVLLYRFRSGEEGCKDAVVVSNVPVSESQCYFEIGMQ